MRTLMISLDASILDEHSAAAERMRAYGELDELHILIPSRRAQKVQLIPSVTVESTGGGKIAQFVRLVQIGRGLVRAHHIERITAQDPFFAGLAGVILKRLTHIQLEVQIHGDFYGSAYYRTSGFGNLVRHFLGLFVIARADTIRCVSKRIKNSLIAHGVSESKINIQPVQIDTEYIQNYAPKIDVHIKYPSYKKIFLFLGRLDKVKNVPWLVRVFAEVAQTHPDALLLVVGAGLERPSIERVIAHFSAARNIKLEGWTDDPYSYLKTSNCLLFPSLSEGYGMVVMEALAAGCNVIMNNVGVAGFEVAQNDDRVKIIEIGDARAFARAIQDICDSK